VKTPIERKRTNQRGKQSKQVRHSIELLKPSAIRWDIINCCAYDALFTILYDIWQDHPSQWSEYFCAQTQYLCKLSLGFSNFRGRSASLEAARDSTRTLFTTHFPTLFPTGMTLTSIDRLAENLSAKPFSEPTLFSA
jgi:hypothetical protein